MCQMQINQRLLKAHKILKNNSKGIVKGRNNVS